MTKSLVILGRQPGLGLAEFESRYGAEKIESVHGEAAVLDIEPERIPFSSLGGVMKLCTLLGSVDSSDWQDIHNYLLAHISDFIAEAPEGKITIGLSLYGFKIGPKAVNATGLTIKKQLKSAGRSCRIIPNKSITLNSAQVLYNKLTSEKGCELVLVQAGSKTLVAKTYREQDIDAYAARDQARPMRDAKVGMLPPKLAQIIINLANPPAGSIILDPFCGTGVVLQEASLMNYPVYGSDIDPRMVDYSQKNLEWLGNLTEQTLTVGDATELTWDQFDAIACETYLGRPFSSIPDRDTLTKVIQDVDTIHRKFLNNIAYQTQPGFRMCIAVPAWRAGHSFKHLPTLDQLDQLGYTRLVFKHVEREDLIYHREGQVVARELIVLKRK